jgi:putative SOS response-associated peptidase YedK
MCGRFVASRPVEELVEEFGIEDVRIPAELLPGPRFNIAPQAEILAVRDRLGEEDGLPHRRLGLYRWGLVPFWAKDPSIGARAFNARAETLAERPMFRAALERRRCIVPADAFYEWQRVGAGATRHKQPWVFRRQDGHPIALAGLYELWRERPAPGTEAGQTGEPEEWLRTCTLITTEANALMAPIHDRMPALLTPDQYDEWLAPGPLEAGHVAALLRPAPDGLLVAYEVGGAVSNSRSQGPELIEPLAAKPSGGAEVDPG